ncbi:MAG: hypothetical protein WKF66_16590 [Pedobacter sp.]
MKANYKYIIPAFVVVIVFIGMLSFRKAESQFQKPILAFKSVLKNAAFCGLSFIEPYAETDIPAMKGWGHYSFKITTESDSAQFFFDQGLSYYYAFHAYEAYASFSKAAKIDTTNAMAWYGKALAMGPNINYGNDYRGPSAAGEAALQSRLFQAGTSAVESALIGAMQVRYTADTSISVFQLRTRYAKAMEQVYIDFPQNPDVITLYADALLLLHPWDLYDHAMKPKVWTAQIRGLLEKALLISPKHPGANHYYIHVLEASAHPELALESAALLDTLMPSVAHITHMPSHIYIRTGNYSQGIIDNDLAVEGFNNSVKAFSPIAGGSGLYKDHNIHLKENCAHMAGNYRIASEAANMVQASVNKADMHIKNSAGNFYQYLYMQPVLTDVRFGKWAQILASEKMDSLGYASVLLHFARGLAFCSMGNVISGKFELKALEEKLGDNTLKYPMDNFSSAYETSLVADLILKGMIAAEEGSYTASIDLLKQAVVAEDNIIYNEPRDWPLPARQYLGTVLIKAKKYPMAVKVLKSDLAINPNNGWALTGLKTVYQQTSNNIELIKINAKLRDAWKIKDLEINAPVF